MPGSTDRVGGDDVFYEDAVKNMERLLQERALPDAVICATDRIAEECTKRWQREILRSEKKCRLWDLAIMRQVSF